MFLFFEVITSLVESAKKHDDVAFLIKTKHFAVL